MGWPRRVGRYLFRLELLFDCPYTPFAVRSGPEPVLRYPSIRARLSTYLYANSSHLEVKLFQKRQKKFREQ